MSFTEILNLSISASWMVLAVAIFRLVLKKAPKALHCALWALVAIRLLCPVSIESGLSLIPTRQVIPQSYLELEPHDSEFSQPAALDIVTNPVYEAPLSIELEPTVDRVQHWDVVATVLWLAGMGVMGLYALYSYISLWLRLRMAGWVSGNIWECDELDSPFIFGLLRPRIYLPSNLDTATRQSVLAHENAHLKRLDHIWKPLGFSLLSVHWFNPIMWLGYTLLCRDIELACDEQVIKKLDKGAIRTYSESLVRCAVTHRSIALCPLAFGEVGVKGRIQAMVRYKKPGLLLTAAAVVLSLLLAACFLTDPVTPETSGSDTHPQVETVRIYRAKGLPSFTAPEFQLSSDGTFTMIPNALTSYHGRGTYTLEDGELELRTEDNRTIYIFIEDHGAYIYDRDRSNDIECFYDAQSFDPLPDGTRFVLTDRRYPASDELNAAITDILEQHYGKPDEPERINTSSFQILDFTCVSGTPLKGTLEPTERLTVNVAVLCCSYRVSDGALVEESSNLVNASLIFQATRDGISLVEMMDTEGSDEYPGNDLFQVYSSAAIDYWNYREETISQILSDRCLQLAQEQLLNPPNVEEVAELLDIICTSPAQSSNPGDYIDAHPKEYGQLLELGRTTVAYCFEQFAEGNCTELRGHIMAIACQEIIGRTEEVYEDGTYMTGQAWFNTFAAHADQQYQAHGEINLRKWLPYHTLALDALGII